MELVRAAQKEKREPLDGPRFFTPYYESLFLNAHNSAHAACAVIDRFNHLVSVGINICLRCPNHFKNLQSNDAQPV